MSWLRGWFGSVVRTDPEPSPLVSSAGQAPQVLEVQELLRGMGQASPGLHTILDESGRVLFGQAEGSCRVFQGGLVPTGPIFAKLDERARGLLEEVFARALSSGQPQALEVDLGQLPELITCAVRMVPLSNRRVYLCGRDVTASAARDHEQRLLEEQLRRLHRMEALGQLAGGVAHDFNNLLTVIAGHAELLRLQLPAGSAGLEDLDRIDAACSNAASLTRRLLDFSRTHVEHAESVDLNLMIAHLQRFLGRLLREDVSLKLSLQEGLSKIHVDAGSIEQVLISLADNAADAMPTGGNFQICTANVTLAAGDLEGAQPGEYVELKLTDSGCGMSEENRRRAFEPFFTTKSLGRGTGLGLTSVEKIVQRSQALMRLTSQEGKGTTFRILFPVEVHTNLMLPDQDTLMPQALGLTGSETLLLCEDDEAVRDVIASTLLGAGYKLLVTPSPAEALRAEDSHEDVLHLLVTDVVLPDKTGVQLALELRENRPGLRVLFVSGHAAEVVRSHGQLTDEHSLLPKPFTPRELLGRVRELLDRRDVHVRN